MTKSKTTDLRKYKIKRSLNFKLIIILAVFLYLLVTVLLYLTNPKVSIYEVREGSILRDTAYTGFIIREEQVIRSKKSGYINYLTPESGKVGAKTKVYALSNEPLSFKETEEKSDALTAEEQSILLVKTQNYSENYNDGQFSDIYRLKTDIISELESKSSQNKQAQIREMNKQMGDALTIYKASDDGVIVYSTDGYENITVDKITESILDKKNYEKKNFTDNTKINADTPVYKLITNDKWTIVINLDEKTATELKEKKSLKVRFTKDNLTATAGFKIQKSGKLTLGLLTFNSSMIRYAQERYLDIELILEDESGLKIPKSSVVKKEFYLVPEEYLTYGGNSNSRGVLVKTNTDKVDFLPVSIYYEDFESAMVYLNPLEFEKNIILLKPDSTETYQLGATKNLQGVYNINKGYALFKQINVLCESDEYYIVEEGSDYGLSNYDHIALDGESVTENDVVF